MAYGCQRKEKNRSGSIVSIQIVIVTCSRPRILICPLTAAAGEPIDVVIATRFPSYAVRHPRKVVWLIHQFRQIYELEGTRFSDFGDHAGDADDNGEAVMVVTADSRVPQEVVDAIVASDGFLAGRSVSL